LFGGGEGQRGRSCRACTAFVLRLKNNLNRCLADAGKDMLETEVPFEPETEMTTVEIPDPAWVYSAEEGTKNCGAL